jgi:hypothetical protein
MSTKKYIFTNVFDHPQRCDRNAKTESCALHCTLPNIHVFRASRADSYDKKFRPTFPVELYGVIDRTTTHYLYVSLYLSCVWSHSAVMRKGRTNSSQERFVCSRSFCFARGSPPLKTTIVKFFAESDDVNYKDLIDALTKSLEYLQTFYNPTASNKFG